VAFDFRKQAFLCFIFLLFLSSVELYFRFFYVETDSEMITLSGRAWVRKYCRYNRQHFRDDRYFGSMKPKNVFRIGILGDSFVEGQGIKDPNNRFSNILEDTIKRKFNGNCEVYNLGKCGWDTNNERNFFLEEGITYDLDVLILSVVEMNDFLQMHIANIPELKDEYLDIRYRDKMLSKMVGYFVDNSYAASFFYAQFLKVRKGSIEKEVVKKAQAVMANKDNWDIFMKCILRIRRACQNNDIKFYLISFPGLHLGKNADLLQLQAEYKKIFESYLNKENIDHLFLGEYFEKYAGEDLTVSQFDLHPNELANKIVAKSLLLLPGIRDRCGEEIVMGSDEV